MKKHAKPTIYDLAEHVGASASTVSSSLDGSWKARRISPRTVERVRAAAREIGFKANRQARGLRTARSGLTGMVLPEHNNRFFSTLSQSFAIEARERGQCPVIVSARREEREEREAVGNLIEYAVDALLIVGASNPDALSELCRAAALPHVFVDQPCRLAPSVVTDNLAGARQLTNCLLQQLPGEDRPPRQRLYFLGGDASLPASARRIEGFEAAMRSADRRLEPSQIIACGYSPALAGQHLHALYDDLGGLPSGLLINSIDCFEGALGFLSRLPDEDLSACTIGCFDHDPFGALLRFPVHMIRQRAATLIREAYRALESCEHNSLILVKPELIEASVNRIPSRETACQDH